MLQESARAREGHAKGAYWSKSKETLLGTRYGVNLVGSSVFGPVLGGSRSTHLYSEKWGSQNWVSEWFLGGYQFLHAHSPTLAVA